MQLYTCKVRLAGNVLHQVDEEVTVPEIMVLRALHGDDAVTDIHHKAHKFKTVREDPNDPENRSTRMISDREERARLTEEYGNAWAKTKATPNLNAIFGVAQPLPKVCDGLPGTVVPEQPIKRAGTPTFDDDPPDVPPDLD
jgi:hypothetical protein